MRKWAQRHQTQKWRMNESHKFGVISWSNGISYSIKDFTKGLQRNIFFEKYKSNEMNVK